MITFKVDDLVPCLKDTKTGEYYDTEVIRIKRKSVLSKFNKKTGWYVDWSKFPIETEVYALVLKGTNDIQGLVAIENDDEALAIHIRWACVSPDNNINKYGKKRFIGVGGHLFAIASDLSIHRGYDGYVYGEAANRELLEYYYEEFNAECLPTLDNLYRFMLNSLSTQKLREVYTYEWTSEEI